MAKRSPPHIIIIIIITIIIVIIVIIVIITIIIVIIIIIKRILLNWDRQEGKLGYVAIQHVTSRVGKISTVMIMGQENVYNIIYHRRQKKIKI